MSAAFGGVLFLGLLFQAACGFGGYKLMENKGQSAGLGFVFGFFLGIIGVVICAVFPQSDARKAEEYARMQSTGPRTGRDTPAAQAEAAVSEELDRLATQHAQGQLTDEEYTAAKRKIVGL